MLVLAIASLNKVHAQQKLDSAQLMSSKQILGIYPKPVQAKILTKLVEYYFEEDLKDSAIHYANVVIDAYTDEPRKPFIQPLMISHYFLGRLSFGSYNYTLGLENLFIAEEYCQLLEDKILLEHIHFYIGTIYLINKDFQNAETYLKSAYYKMAERKQHKFLEALENLCELYISSNQTDSATYYCEHFNKMCFKYDVENIALSYHYLSKLNSFTQNFNEANKYAQTGLQFIESYPNIKTEIRLLLDLSLSHAKIGELEKALRYYGEVSSKLDQSLRRSVLEYYSIGAQVYALNGDYKKAISNFQNYLVELENINESQNQVVLRNLRKQYELHEKNKQIEVLQTTNIGNEEDLRKNRTWLLSITALTVLLVFTFTIIYYMQREKFKNRRIISAQRAELTKKQFIEELNVVELKAAKAHIEGQERERERLARELHDGIGGTLAGIKMELESYMGQKGTSTQLNRISDLIVSTYKEVRAISHNFAIPEVMKGDFQEILKAMIQNIPGKNGLYVQLSIFQNINWDNIDSNIKIELYRIVQESVTNIIKHAEAKNAEVQIVEDDGFLNLTIEDDGKGFNVSSAKKGLGLRNLNSRAEVLKGKFEVDTSPGNGTFLYFNIPLIVTS